MPRPAQNCPVCSSPHPEIPADAFQCSADFLTVAALDLAIHCHEQAAIHGGTEMFPMDNLMAKLEILGNHKRRLLTRMEADMQIIATAASWLNSELYKGKPGEPCPGCGEIHE